MTGTAGLWAPMKPSLEAVLARLEALSLEPEFAGQRQAALEQALRPYLEAGAATPLAPLPQEVELANLYVYADFYPEGRLRSDRATPGHDYGACARRGACLVGPVEAFVYGSLGGDSRRGRLPERDVRRAVGRRRSGYYASPVASSPKDWRPGRSCSRGSSVNRAIPMPIARSFPAAPSC
ncbi:MAG: hypothetical protein KatS3mg082_0603 [Nitrospiraceae bacterium]|nr:MAG: hypothetical protein KatS3mg082_0603 [Nitrospiraceae bacterium]